MAGPRDRDRDRDRGDRDDRRGGVRRGRRKHCQFCVAKVEIIIDYKNVSMLRQYLDDRARIRKARQTGTCRRHQNRVSSAIKRSREMALIPYVAD
ncbi:MAG TPA: 30S ribosomal protein S18 [Armatimonadota bacterium]